ncbi:hypothetical protein AB0F91_23830 [Amycolatopsis sp. NPDC023774]|uniref:hypothetical protein n=1 Tax=Amycolatopsis sp. NPDC023774 TaxID=3155015 RepID=UPI0033E902AA
MKVDEIIAANLAGRLHPGQRHIVIDFKFWLCLAVGGIAALLCVVLPMAMDVFEGPQRAKSFAAFPFLVLLAVVYLGLRAGALPRPAQAAGGGNRLDPRLRPGPDDEHLPDRLAFRRRQHPHGGPVGGPGRRKAHLTERETWEKIKPARNNTLCLYPKTKLIINVIPA